MFSVFYCSFMFQCDSDFDEVFQRLKSEKQWTDISDGTLRHALAVSYGPTLVKSI